MNAPYEVTDHDRHLVAVRFRPQLSFREAFPRIEAMTRRRLFDHYYELAENVARLPGGLNDDRRRVRADLFDFAYWLSDISCDYLERQRYRIANKWPAYGAEIARLRACGRVPAPAKGVHVFVALRFAYRRAAPGACIVVEAGPDFELFDYRFMAGLTVEIMATASDLDFSDWLARRMAADGTRKITRRRLDNPTVQSETLYDAGVPWRR